MTRRWTRLAALACLPLTLTLAAGCEKEEFEYPVEAEVAPPPEPLPEPAEEEPVAGEDGEFDWQDLRALSPEAAVEHMDADGNGVIDLPDEAEPRVLALVTGYDRNNDQQVTAEEIEQGRADRARQLSPAGAGRPAAPPIGQLRPIEGEVGIVPQPGENVTVGPPPATPIPVGMFGVFDSNDDGSLSPSEIPENMREGVLKAEGDGDGSVSKEELETYEQEQQRLRPMAE